MCTVVVVTAGPDPTPFADRNEDAPLLACARQLAPFLLDRHASAAQAHVQRWLGTKAEFLKA